jgi:hypothetical protein
MIARDLDASIAKIREAIEFRESDLLNLDAEVVLQPLRGQVTMAPDFSGGAIVSLFPAEHHSRIAKSEQTVADFGWV